MRGLAIAICASLYFVSGSFAHPLDSPGTVYIDGVPCNLACQSYMKWSRQALKANEVPVKGAANMSAGIAPRQVLHKHVSKRSAPALVSAPSHKKIQAALTQAPASPPPPVLPTPRAESAPPKVESAEVPRERNTREQVAAALAVAELISNAQTSKAGDDGADEASRASVGAGNANPAEHVGAQVALLIARPDVKSASALEGSNIAIEASQSGAEENLRSALAAAGAPDIQFSVVDANPLDRLLGGDVQAAVLKLVSPDAAEAFPDIKGFRVFRLSFVPR